MKTPASHTLTNAEEKLLLEYLYHHDRRYYTAAVIALTTGLRISELCALTRADVASADQVRSILTVRAEISKNRVERSLPLPTMTRQVIASWLALTAARRPYHRPTDRLLVATNNRDPMTARSFQRALAQAARLTIHRRVTPHILRHTYLTRLSKHTDLRTVQELAGHRSIRSTQLYVHPDMSDLQQAVASAYPEVRETT